MDMFKMIKEAAAMKSRLSQMEKELKNKIIDVEQNGVKIRINAKSEILSFELNPEQLKHDHKKIEREILSAIQHAIKKSQDVMAEEAKKLTGGLKIPGLM